MVTASKNELVKVLGKSDNGVVKL